MIPHPTRRDFLQASSATVAAGMATGLARSGSAQNANSKLVIGLIGSTIGLLLGFALAQGLKSVFGGIGSVNTTFVAGSRPVFGTVIW